uniref:Uncharacterized protein n=1 Tax=viral metagenome TaxID=1070528 RepID=A0A6M3KKS5_9ZZZZ
MGFTCSDIKTPLAQRTHKLASVTDHNTSLKEWIKSAVRYAQRFDFECWKEEFSLTLTPLTYAYAYAGTVWPTAALTRPLRIDGDSIEDGNGGRIEHAKSMNFLDAILGGPEWKRSATGGAVTHWTSRGQSIIVGTRPSTAYVTDHPLFYGYYYRGEDLTSASYETTSLAMYDDFFEHILSLAEVFGSKQEDDTTFQANLQYWLQHDLPEMRGYDHVPEEDEPIPAPEWATYIEGTGIIS